MRVRRFQDSPWYVRLWRRRHYLTVPYYAIRMTSGDLSFRHAWSVAVGLAHASMHWYYTFDEVRAELKDRKP